MNKIFIASFPFFLAVSFSNPVMSEDTTFRRSNFSNEFNIKTPEGINARGSAVVTSAKSKHHVKINANGLNPGETYVILNHWFDPIPGRGVPDSPGALVDPSCNGHFQFLGTPIAANNEGEIKVNVKVDQLAPHIWVANLAKFMEVTKGGTQAPANADAFATGGLLIPYADIVSLEAAFVDTSPLTDCGM
jgi:hypothetical protein